MVECFLVKKCNCKLDFPVEILVLKYNLQQVLDSEKPGAVCVQRPCAVTCINICAHVKIPKHWQPHRCLDTQKYYAH